MRLSFRRRRKNSKIRLVRGLKYDTRFTFLYNKIEKGFGFQKLIGASLGSLFLGKTLGLMAQKLIRSFYYQD